MEVCIFAGSIISSQTSSRGKIVITFISEFKSYSHQSKINCNRLFPWKHWSSQPENQSWQQGWKVKIEREGSERKEERE